MVIVIVDQRAGASCWIEELDEWYAGVRGQTATIGYGYYALRASFICTFESRIMRVLL